MRRGRRGGRPAEKVGQMGLETEADPVGVDKVGRAGPPEGLELEATGGVGGVSRPLWGLG